MATDIDTLNEDWKYKRRPKFGVRKTQEFIVEFEVIKDILIKIW